LGYTLKKSESRISETYEFNDSEIEILSEMEHNRWCAERWIMGWKFGENNNREMKISKDLIPYHTIKEEERDKDREFVKKLPEILARLNFRVVKNI
jgi:hypothetical protein